MKAEKKAAKKNGNGATITLVSDIPTPPSPPSLSSQKFPLQHGHGGDSGPDATPAGQYAGDAKYVDIGSITQKKKGKKQEPKEWTLSGREAEALHMSEEEGYSDEGQQGQENSNERDGVKDPLQRMLQSG